MECGRIYIESRRGKRFGFPAILPLITFRRDTSNKRFKRPPSRRSSRESRRFANLKPDNGLLFQSLYVTHPKPYYVRSGYVRVKSTVSRHDGRPFVRTYNYD